MIWATRRDRESGEQTAWMKQSLPQRYLCVSVNSTLNRQADHFVWKDAAECVTRPCDDTVDRKRVNSCVLKHLFWRKFKHQKNRQKTRKCSLRRATNVTFSKYCGWRRKKPRSAKFLKPRFAQSELIQWFKLIWGRRFWEVCFFAVSVSLSLSLSLSLLLSLALFLSLILSLSHSLTLSLSPSLSFSLSFSFSFAFCLSHSFASSHSLSLSLLFSYILGASQLRTGCLLILIFLTPLAEVTP